MTTRVSLVLALLAFSVGATAQTRAITDEGKTVWLFSDGTWKAADVDAAPTRPNETPPLEEISRIYPYGTGSTYSHILGGIRQGKDGSKGCIELVNRDSAQAVLVAVDQVGPVTWVVSEFGVTRKKAARTQTAFLQSMTGEVLWKGKKANFFQRSLLKQLASALKCKARAKSNPP